LRQALAAQLDFGVGELVVGSKLQADARETANLFANAGRIVSAANAVASSQDGEASQSGMDLMSESSYTSLAEHCQAICDCKSCPLGETRNKFVYGAGNPDADLLFVGEAPGADEDRIGEPFVGRAGQLLDKILVAMGMSRDDVYIANILKCRPPGNRDPQPDEMTSCFPYLREQVRLIRPKLICALGRIAAQAMLQTKTPLGKLRGQWHSFEGVPMLVTYHPAALLRFQAYKKDTWADMQLIMARLKELET
ncbi:MAG: hypothetical protein DRP45_08140, partial [Candidatus Zixiibacteriota bacterium]